jgi:hypothetical protein
MYIDFDMLATMYTRIHSARYIVLLMLTWVLLLYAVLRRICQDQSLRNKERMWSSIHAQGQVHVVVYTQQTPWHLLLRLWAWGKKFIGLGSYITL